MANLRKMKRDLKGLLSRDNWQEHLPEIAAQGSAAVGALFSFLLLDPELMHRAAAALGETVAAIYAKEPETGRNIMRRFMWHMNEDSGNIGWGIPDAFAEAVARSEGLRKEYGRILLSYIMDLGFADNYCDHAMLRRDCYWGAGRLLQADPQFCPMAHPWLVKGLTDEDAVCRGMAAWALGQCAINLTDVPALRTLLREKEVCQIFDKGQLLDYLVTELAERILQGESD